MRYDWIEKDGYYCAASEWQPSCNEPTEWRLVFKIARAADDNAWIADTRLDFSGFELVFRSPMYGAPAHRTGIMSDTVCDFHETRDIPKPKVTRRKTKYGEVKVTDWTWEFCCWKPVVRYESA